MVVGKATTFMSANQKTSTITETYSLSNGTKIPVTGHGAMEKSWFFDPAENARIVTVLSHAIRRGLRLIDTAKIYGTEELIGRAVRESDVPRDQITVITKLWNADHHRVQEAFAESLSKLMLDYVDIYIMHWPCALADSDDGFTGIPLAIDESPTFLETYAAMESLIGPRCRAIGVSNFTQKTLTTLLSHCNISPVINEIEVHPLYPQTQLVPWCQSRGITVVAWGPLVGGPASGYGDTFKDLYNLSILQTLATKYHASADAVAPLLLSWLYTRGIIAIPHSSSVERIVKNLRVVTLEEGDVQVLNHLHEHIGGPRRLADASPVWNTEGPGGRGRTVFGWTVQEIGWEDEQGNVLG